MEYTEINRLKKIKTLIESSDNKVIVLSFIDYLIDMLTKEEEIEQ